VLARTAAFFGVAAGVLLSFAVWAFYIFFSVDGSCQRPIKSIVGTLGGLFAGDVVMVRGVKVARPSSSGVVPDDEHLLHHREHVQQHRQGGEGHA
jgi:hypothetical protein